MFPLQAEPKFWEILSDPDKSSYIQIYSKLRFDVSKTKRGRIDVFSSRLKIIHDFIYKDDIDVWKRSVVSGVLFLTNALAINIQQLKILLGKCKSSINRSLQLLGFTSKALSTEVSKEIDHLIPFKSYFESKKWSIRFGDMKDLQPAPKISQPFPQEAVIATETFQHYPCPAKLRHKFYDIIHTSMSIQTEA